jgi:hypothetical protein
MGWLVDREMEGKKGVLCGPSVKVPRGMGD